MRKLIRWAVYGILLAGCASPPNSQTLTADTALVSFVGRHGDNREALVEAAIGEAAKVARERGYRYFTILGTADASQAVSRRVSGDFYSLQRRGIGNVTRNYLLQFPDNTVEELKPGVDITIRMYREGAIDASQEGVWNSAAIIDGQRSSAMK